MGELMRREWEGERVKWYSKKKTALRELKTNETGYDCGACSFFAWKNMVTILSSVQVIESEWVQMCPCVDIDS